MKDDVKQVNWVHKLMEEVEGFDGEMFPPSEPVAKNEKVVGICSDYMRKLYSLARYHHRECKQAALEIEFSSKKEEHAPFEAKLDQAHDKNEILMQMFWASGQELFGCWGIDGKVGVRKDWQFVIAPKDDDKASLLKFLKGLSGQ
jgi:hypothetical protein